MKCEPADFMSHDFHDEDTSVGGRGRVDTIDRIRRDIHSALESERHIRSPEIVIDSLRKSDHIESFLA